MDLERENKLVFTSIAQNNKVYAMHDPIVFRFQELEISLEWIGSW